NAHFYGYGYGWRVSDMDGQWKVAHTGTLSGMYSSLALLPDRKVGVVNAHFYGYGYGWRVSDMDGQWKVAHTGTLSGMYS
ncbi:hypothetical protein C7E12_22095, partial [Stenotrophomonas maltophilia]